MKKRKKRHAAYSSRRFLELLLAQSDGSKYPASMDRVAHGLGAEVHEEPGMLWFLSGLPFHLANGIVQTHISERVMKERLKQFTAYHLPIAWLVSPSTRPA